MDNKYNYILNTTDAPYIQYWFAKKLSDIASASIVGEGTDFEITSPSERSLKKVVLKGDTTQETSPTPDSPQTVNTVTGDQTITITKGSDVQTYFLTLGDLELCKIGDYQDYIYKDGDKWYKKSNCGKETLPTSGYTKWATSAGIFYINSYPQGAKFGNKLPTGYSSQFICFNQVQSVTNFYNDYGTNRYGLTLKWGTAGVIIMNRDYTELSDFHTWISNNPVTLYYILNEATDTEITDETLLGQLNTILSDGYLSAGTNTVQTSATGLPIIINIKA